MDRTARMALLRRFPGAPYGRWVWAGGLFVLAACTGARREAGQREPVGPSTLDRVAICYSTRDSAQDTVLRLAESECAKTSRVPVRAFEQPWGCTMVSPRRIYFDCVPKP